MALLVRQLLVTLPEVSRARIASRPLVLSISWRTTCLVRGAGALGGQQRREVRDVLLAGRVGGLAGIRQLLDAGRIQMRAEVERVRQLGGDREAPGVGAVDPGDEVRRRTSPGSHRGTRAATNATARPAMIKVGRSRIARIFDRRLRSIKSPVAVAALESPSVPANAGVEDWAGFAPRSPERPYATRGKSDRLLGASGQQSAGRRRIDARAVALCRR